MPTPIPLKMPGAKTRTMSAILPHLMPLGDRWAVRFFGTGASAMALLDAGQRIEYASDGNRHLVAMLRELRTSPDRFVAAVDRQAQAIEVLGTNLQREFYARLRAGFNAGDAGAGDYFLLWRMAFNGVPRFNPRGQWNVGPGITDKTGPKKRIFDRDALLIYGRALGRIPEVDCAAWPDETLPPGLVPYDDPPYYRTFDSYGTPFDHVRWHAERRTMAGPWAMSNSMGSLPFWGFPEGSDLRTPFTRQILTDNGIETLTGYPVERAGTISAKGSGRQSVWEMLFTCG